MTEDLATLVTLIRFLAGVDSLMDDQGRAPDEGLATVFTFVGFLSSVDSPVLRISELRMSPHWYI